MPPRPRRPLSFTAIATLIVIAISLIASVFGVLNGLNDIFGVILIEYEFGNEINNVFELEKSGLNINECELNNGALTPRTATTTNNSGPTGVGLNVTNVIEIGLTGTGPAITIATTAAATVTIVKNKNINNFYGEPNGHYHYPCVGSPPVTIATTTTKAIYCGPIGIGLAEFNVIDNIFNVGLNKSEINDIFDCDLNKGVLTPRTINTIGATGVANNSTYTGVIGIILGGVQQAPAIAITVAATVTIYIIIRTNIFYITIKTDTIYITIKANTIHITIKTDTIFISFKTIQNKESLWFYCLCRIKICARIHDFDIKEMIQLINITINNNVVLST